MINEILSGIGAGVMFSLSAFSKKQNTKFETKKFAKTIIIGAIAGLGMYVLDMPVDATYEYLIMLGAVPVVENLIKIIERKLMPLFS